MPRKPYGLDDSLRLRKYRDSGKKLWEIIDSDPDYVLWAIENVDGFEIDNEAFERLRETVPYHPYFRS